MNKDKCDCTVNCGDDPRLKTGAAAPCEHFTKRAAQQAPSQPAGYLGDGATIRCRKCGEQTAIEFNSARIVTHNPHTGKPRDSRDIASDPEGKLMVDPSAPLHTTSPAQPPSKVVREGLTKTKVINIINRLRSKYPSNGLRFDVELARAIEHAHGIGIPATGGEGAK